MKTEQIRLVLEIAKARSISEAADVLDMSQPTASNMLKTLERELGYQLFRRSRAGMTATEEGTRFLEYAQTISYSLDAIQRISDHDKKVEFRVIAMGNDFSELAFEDLCEKCNSMHPDFDLRFQKVSSIDHAIKLIKAGEGDMAFILLPAHMTEDYQKNLTRGNLVMIPVSETHLDLTVKKNHPLIREGRIAYHHLNKYTCICSVPMHEENPSNPNLFTEQELKRTITIEQGSGCYQLLKRTDGFLISVPLPKETLNSHGLVSFPLEDSQLCCHVVYWKDSPKKEMIQEALDAYQKVLKTLPDSSEILLEEGLTAI